MKKRIVALTMIKLCTQVVDAQAGTTTPDKKVIETIIYEAADQGLIGMTAVACVIRNRAKERDLTPLEVVTQPFQFSCWLKGANRWKYTADTFRAAEQAWDLSKSFKLDSNLYYNPTLCLPSWANSPNVKKVCKVGQHIFMKEAR